jgi:ABC-type sugar transport system permease subunit
MSQEGRLFKSRYQIAFLFIGPYALSFIFFSAYPVLLSLPTALKQYDYMTGRHLWVGLTHFKRALLDPTFFKAWWNTLYLAWGGILLGFWPPMLLAILVNELRKAQGFWRTFLYIPAVCAGTTAAALWKWIYNPEFGLLNHLLKLVGLPPQTWLMDPHLVKLCLIFMGVVMGTGREMLFYLAALQNIPDQLYEAAEIDGASIWQKLRYITLPELLPLIKTLFILSVIKNMHVFSEIFMMTKGGPCGASQTLTYYIWETAFKHMEMGYATAMGIYVFFVSIVLTTINIKVLKRRDIEV